MTEIFGVQIEEPPEGWTCLEVIVVIKALDETGSQAMCVRCSDGLWSVEALGMLTAAETEMGIEVAQTFVAEE